MRSLKHFRKLFLCSTAVLALSAISVAAADSATWTIGPFHRPADASPVVKPQKQSLFNCPMRKAPVRWESLHTFNPAAVVRNGKVYVLYRAEDDSGEMQIGMHTSRIGLAVSDDGRHFTRRPTPVLFPAEDSETSREADGGVEDPRVVQTEDGTYVLTYTQWNRKIFRVGIATSRDLVTWTKHGPAFGTDADSKYGDLAYKSAGIVTRMHGGRLIAAKISGKYWMYWGEGAIHLATSKDLIHWSPVEGADGKPLVVLTKRVGHFDSAFPEVGPPPVLTDRGIVLLYNGKNSKGADADPSVGPNAYAVGQALFSSKDPTKLLERTENPFFKPELAFEKNGQYTAGTTFAEGLVSFKGKWFLYYGCADSFVGVAISE